MHISVFSVNRAPDQNEKVKEDYKSIIRNLNQNRDDAIRMMYLNRRHGDIRVSATFGPMGISNQTRGQREAEAMPLVHINQTQRMLSNRQSCHQIIIWYESHEHLLVIKRTHELLCKFRYSQSFSFLHIETKTRCKSCCTFLVLVQASLFSSDWLHVTNTNSLRVISTAVTYMVRIFFIYLFSSDVTR